MDFEDEIAKQLRAQRNELNTGNASVDLSAVLEGHPSGRLLRASEELLASGNEADRILAARILGEVRASERDRGALLLAALVTEDNSLVLEYIISAFGTCRYTPALPHLAKLAAHESPQIRYAVGGALSACSIPALGDDARRILLRMLDDPDDDVRYSAMHELVTWWLDEDDKGTDIEQAILGHRGDYDTRIRRLVAEALG